MTEVKIVGYYTSNTCTLGNPLLSDDPATKILILDEKGSVQILSPPFHPLSIKPVATKTAAHGNKLGQLENLLRIDSASGRKPIPTFSKQKYFLAKHKSGAYDSCYVGDPPDGVYALDGTFLGYHQPRMAPTSCNTANHIIDKNGITIGYFNTSELFNQSGEKVATKKGDKILRDGKVLGYFRDEEMFDANETLIGFEEHGNGKVFLAGKIVANLEDDPDDPSRSANDLFLFRKYTTSAPELSSSAIKKLKQIANTFHPKTPEGKALRGKLLLQLKLIENSLAQIKDHPKEALLRGHDRLSKIAALWMLAENKNLDRDGKELIIQAAHDRDRFVRYSAITILGRLKIGLKTIASALRDKDYRIAEVALLALHALIERTSNAGSQTNKEIYNYTVEAIYKSHGGVRFRAIKLLAKSNFYFLPLLTKFDPRGFDIEVLIMIGREIGRAKNLKLFNAIYKETLETKDAAAFKINSYILLEALGSWKERLEQSEIGVLYLNKLNSPDAEISQKRLSVFVLTRLIKLYPNSQRANEVAEKLLNRKGPLEIFILRNLAAVREFLSPKNRKLIEDKINDKIIAKSPPYQEWFNQTKNPNKIITAKVYVDEVDVWENLFKGDGYSVIRSEGREISLEKKVNGVVLRVMMVNISTQEGKTRINIFQDLANPSVHYVGYSGHAGMGGNLEMREPRKAGDPIPYGTKIVHIGACSSMPSYYARILKVVPNVQFIGNTIASYSEDDAKVFISAMNGIAFRKSWSEINADIKKKAPFIYHTQKEKERPITFFNHMLPNNIDQQRYAILDELETGGTDTLAFSAPQRDLLEINSRFGGRVRQAVNNVNVSFGYQPFFSNIEIVTGDEIHDGIYFLSPTDNQRPLEINRAGNVSRPIYKIEVNAGYSHMSIDALTVLLLYELNSYFSKEKHEKTTKEDKLRGLLMVVEYIHYHYQGRSWEALQMFDIFKQKYGFAPEIQFAAVHHLIEAIDNNLPQKEELKTKLLGMIK